MNRLTTKNHQGVVAFVSPIVYQDLSAVVPQIFENGETPLLLILDRITDVRNMGAIARTAECTGVHAIIVPSRGSAQLNSDAMKTSAGALHKIPVCRENNLKDTITYLQECGIQIVACTEKAENYHFNTDMLGPIAVIMGSEEDGISPEYLKRCDAKAKLPMTGTIGSLNVSVACGTLLYEVIRQRITNEFYANGPVLHAVCKLHTKMKISFIFENFMEVCILP